MAAWTYSILKTRIAETLERDDLTSDIPYFIEQTEDRIAANLRIGPMEARKDIALESATKVDADGVGGTADAITLTPDTAITSYVQGQRWTFTAEATNTSTVTVNISAVGSRNVKKYEEGIISDLAAGDIQNTHTITLYDDGTQLILTDGPQIPLPDNFIGFRRHPYLDGDPTRELRYLTPVNFWTRYLSAINGKPQAYTIENEMITLGPAMDAAYSMRLLYWKRFAALSSDSDTNWVLSNARGLYLYGALLEAEPFLENDQRAITWAKFWDQALEDAHTLARDRQYAATGLEAQSEYTSDSVATTGGGARG